MTEILNQMLGPQNSIRNVLEEFDSAGARNSDSAPQGQYVPHTHRYNVRSRYEFIRTLGKGTYGKVKLAVERETGRKFAVKAIRKDRVKAKNDMKHIRREMKIMSSLQHPNIIQIHEVFENQDKIVIVMEYAPKGELYEYLSERKITNELESCVFFKQIVSAVKYCHERGVVHRDLKLENILLGENYEIKIADFGLANLFRSDELLQTFCGSPLYASPEIVNGIKYVGPEVDSWSLGVLLYALVYGMMPFDGSDYKMLTWQITNGEYSKQSKYPDADDLISQMLTVDPTKRANIHQIANHHWLLHNTLPAYALPMATKVFQQEFKPDLVDSNANYVNHHTEEIVPEVTSEVERILSPQPANGPLSCENNCKNIFCANIHCPQPKSILKHNEPPQTGNSIGDTPTIKEEIIVTQHQNLVSVSPLPSYIAGPPIQPDCLNNHKDAAACGLQAKDSLKLKAKPLGASGKRRVLRSKRDRESGYYSSPERTPVDLTSITMATPAFSFTPPVIKPQLTTNIMPNHMHLRSRHQVPQHHPGENLLPSQFCTLPVGCSYIVPMANPTSPMPIIEGQQMTYLPEYVTPTACVPSAYDHRMPAMQYTLRSLNSEGSQSNGKRPISTYSDSSILSSDSFELCTFDSPLSTYSPTATVNSTVDTFVNMSQSPGQYLYSNVRPTTLPINLPMSSPQESSRFSPTCSSAPQPSGTLTPTSAKLHHDLHRILGPKRPRKSGDNKPLSYRFSAPQTTYTDDQTDQLDEMMRQLNLDLEKAYKKALDMRVSFTTSAEV